MDEDDDALTRKKRKKRTLKIPYLIFPSDEGVRWWIGAAGIREKKVV